MNTLKIFSILVFSLFSFIVSMGIILRIIKYKVNSEEKTYSKLLHYSSLFIGVSIILNLVFQKVSYLYDLIDQYSYSFQKVFSFGKFNYGFSPEMINVSVIYVALCFVWVCFSAFISKITTTHFFSKSSWENQLMQSVIFLSINIAFYPVLSFILDNFYIVLDRPTIN